MADILTKSGIFFDELNKIRVLDPKVSDQANELKEECKFFIEKLAEFQTLTDGFITMMDSLASEVEKEKMRVIGGRNKLQSMTKQKQSQQQQLQALTIEKSMELERLRSEYHSLQKTLAEQQDIIDQLTQFS